ncbi:MAG: hypothetical protein IPG04_00620 [Polyangiaceae bacterium]|nr:hypothetical protein [Polyangiaceae bacterium]
MTMPRNGTGSVSVTPQAWIVRVLHSPLRDISRDLHPGVRRVRGLAAELGLGLEEVTVLVEPLLVPACARRAGALREHAGLALVISLLEREKRRRAEAGA